MDTLFCNLSQGYNLIGKTPFIRWTARQLLILHTVEPWIWPPMFIMIFCLLFRRQPAENDGNSDLRLTPLCKGGIQGGTRSRGVVSEIRYRHIKASPPDGESFFKGILGREGLVPSFDIADGIRYQGSKCFFTSKVIANRIEFLRGSSLIFGDAGEFTKFIVFYDRYMYMLWESSFSCVSDGLD